MPVKPKRPLLATLAPIGLIILLIHPTYTTLVDGRDLVSSAKPADRYADAAIWLHDNAPAGTHIFQTDWDDFTRLFFYNTNATYTAGLDPTFMELHDKELFDLWVDITRSKVDNPGPIIRDTFGSQYIFSDLNHDAFMKKAEADPTIEELYRTDDAVIYMVTK